MVFTTAAYEMVTTRRLFTLCREDTRIGYETSNHYYCLLPDLAEKVINCEYVLARIRRETPLRFRAGGGMTQAPIEQNF